LPSRDFEAFSAFFFGLSALLPSRGFQTIGSFAVKRIGSRRSFCSLSALLTARAFLGFFVLNKINKIEEEEEKLSLAGKGKEKKRPSCHHKKKIFFLFFLFEKKSRKKAAFFSCRQA
jgi:hypothetical protein